MTLPPGPIRRPGDRGGSGVEQVREQEEPTRVAMGGRARRMPLTIFFFCMENH